MGKCQVSSKKENTSVTKANALQIGLRKLFLKIDLVRFKKLVNRLEREKFDYILSDRYFYDSLVNIAYLSKKEITSQYSIIKPELSIYLQANPELIMSRNRVPDQGLQYLIDKKYIYNKYASLFEMKVLDGNKDKEEIQKEIKALL